MQEKKKLRWLAQKVEQCTHGKQTVAYHNHAGLYIKACDHALTQIILRMQSEQEDWGCRLEFAAKLRLAGEYDAAHMLQLSQEAGEIALLLEELEAAPILFTEQELAAFCQELAEQESGKEQAQEPDQPLQLDPALGAI